MKNHWLQNSETGNFILAVRADLDDETLRRSPHNRKVSLSRLGYCHGYQDFIDKIVEEPNSEIFGSEYAKGYGHGLEDAKNGRKNVYLKDGKWCHFLCYRCETPN